MMVLQACSGCNEKFIPKYKSQTYCSRKCSGKEKSSVELPCENCGKLVTLKQYRKTTFHFCSRKCSWAYKIIHDRIEKQCSICGNIFSIVNRDAKNAKYCSKHCYYVAMNAVGSIQLTCVICQKPFRRAPSKFKKDRPQCCSIACRGILKRTDKPKRASNARNWLGTHGKIKQCNRCAYAEHLEILVVHHKDRNRKNNNLDNLEILCPNCHALEHYGEKIIQSE